MMLGPDCDKVVAETTAYLIQTRSLAYCSVQFDQL